MEMIIIVFLNLGTMRIINNISNNKPAIPPLLREIPMFIAISNEDIIYMSFLFIW